MASTLTAQPVNYSLPGAYQQQQLDAENIYQQALNNIAQQSASVSNQKGFAYDTGADGNINNVRIDPNNQYSEVMGLMGGHAQALHSLRGQLAGRGLGGVGLAAKRAQLLKFVQGGETSNVGKSFLDQIAGLQNQKSGALSARNTAFNAAETGAQQYAIQQQQFEAAQAAAQQQLLAYQQALAQYQASGGTDTGGGDPGGAPPADPTYATAQSSGVVSPLGGNTAPGVPNQQQIAGALKMTAPVPITFGGQTFGAPKPSTVNYQARSRAY